MHPLRFSLVFLLENTVIYTAHLFSQMQMAVGDWRTLFVALETPAPPEAKLTPLA